MRQTGRTYRSILPRFERSDMNMVALLMNLAPFGVFCLMAKLFTTLGLSAVVSLAEYFFVLAGRPHSQ
ncbi:dicarboxylate/amino acid:cation symporter [Grimontia kaedaensis]|uniref:Dicarboxylate/amino acid:cation symporter n=1 Tax=Grimontia kaedaensis TaxID=2872157 RepID=A0ABY4WYU2_9GAMM|nr:cation:dicarboxylase symporter family transporter [Grimontia kaedaensis]USH04152.1 dicarboxylate/amino acid:cation symporter [Grimontia kaedaensis]